AARGIGGQAHAGRHSPRRAGRDAARPRDGGRRPRRRPVSRHADHGPHLGRGPLMGGGEPFIRWSWIGEHLGEIGARTLQHLELTGIAVAIGFAIAMALSILALRRRATYTPITWFAGVLYTIPSIALFALLVPITGLSTIT